MPRDWDRIEPAVVSQALRNETALIVAARTITHTTAARRLGIAKQTLSDWLGEHHKDATRVYAAHGLKLVPADDNNYSEEIISAMQLLAQKGLQSLAPIKRNFARVVEDEVVDDRTDAGESQRGGL